jgi:hypothetical protein
MASIFCNAGISEMSFNYCWDLYAFLKQTKNIWGSSPWQDEYFELKITAQHCTFFPSVSVACTIVLTGPTEV